MELEGHIAFESQSCCLRYDGQRRPSVTVLKERAFNNNAFTEHDSKFISLSVLLIQQMIITRELVII